MPMPFCFAIPFLDIYHELNIYSVWKDTFIIMIIIVLILVIITFFFSIGKICLCVLGCFSHVWLFATLWTIACQPPLTRGPFRQEYWSAMPSSRGSFWPRDQTQVSCSSYIAGGFFTAEPPGKPVGEIELVKPIMKLGMLLTFPGLEQGHIEVHILYI